ncbi:MAG: HAD hydrolase family protein [Ruminococcus sp.]|nr:HAD hydrolase family protein [Ruminococcus sp.]MDE7099010.1 HAD hydrolase family protein [Ruminococcus sp.]
MDIFFACDLDNTLIYSYKKKEDGYICVEINKGMEQGFMTQYVYNNFIAMTKKVRFIPVTTRSVEQYNRIHFPHDYIPEYALVSNGATLIHNGTIQTNWNLIEKNSSLENQLKEVYSRYKNDKRFTNCRIIDESYVYVYCADDTDAEKTAIELAEAVDMTVELSGKKIYFFPENLNKGNAVKKLNDIIGSDSIISAGDSSMDCTMLDIADKAVIPADFDMSLIKNRCFVKSTDKIFSDFLINYILDK